MGDQIIMFISQIFNGLKIGSVYSLVALGYTMVYGIIRLINFAHGDFIMVGSYVLMLTIPAIVAFGLPPWVAVHPRDPHVRGGGRHRGEGRIQAGS